MGRVTRKLITYKKIKQAPLMKGSGNSNQALLCFKPEVWDGGGGGRGGFQEGGDICIPT